MAKDRKSIYQTLNLFFGIFIIVGGIVSGLVFTFYRTEVETFYIKLKIREQLAVELQDMIIGEAFETIVSDLYLLAEQNELINFLDTDNKTWLHAIQSEYLNISTRKQVYDQIRFLDHNGKERVRVNFNNNRPVIVDSNKLQNKSGRYYFSDTIDLEREEVFISPLDLNVEQGKVEVPLKPMIRFGTPVYDSKSKKRGIVLVNYLAENILLQLQKNNQVARGSTMLLNTGSYWLYNSSNKANEWGFMFKDRQDIKFSNSYPKEWAEIVRRGRGQLETENGLFTFARVRPLKEEFYTSSNTDDNRLPMSPKTLAADYAWIILSYTPPEVIQEHKKGLLIELFTLGAGVFVIIALGAWYIAHAATKRRLYQAELFNLATQDTLTGLPNRRSFFQSLDTAVEHAKRHSRSIGLLYIDLDGFKKVNDNWGHDVGDELLQKVGNILIEFSRSSDIVARLGGDEFACILLDIESIEGALGAGTKLIEALSKPTEIAGKSIIIGASVGVSIFPDHSRSPEKLLKMADRAMYDSKAQGKNCCTLYSENRS